MKKMTGIITPLSCPMTADQVIDFNSLEKLCEFLISKGVHGLYPNGSCGEMGLLTLEERKKVLECCVKTAAGRIPVFSMVGALKTQDTIELAQHAEKSGADGVGVVTPYYFRLDQKELEEYFVRVAQSVSPFFSVYLYGIPQLAVNDITVELAERLAQRCSNIVGIKYSYPDMPRLQKFMGIRNGSFSVVAGSDELLLATLCAGGDGTISGNSNVIPEHFVAIYDAYRKGDIATARKLQQKTNRLIDFISGPNNMARYKSCLRHRGIIQNATVREPLRNLSDAEEKELFETIEKLDYQNPAGL